MVELGLKRIQRVRRTRLAMNKMLAVLGDTNEGKRFRSNGNEPTDGDRNRKNSHRVIGFRS